MKRILAFTLCLLMVLTLMACGGEKAPAEVPTTPTNTPSTEPTQAPTEAIEETEPVEEPAFDSTWASNDFEKLIPLPPFEGWTGKEMAPNLYMMTCTNGNEADWEVYAQTLMTADFSLEDVGRGYKGYDAMGNYFEFMCTENQAMILIETVG